MYRTREEELLTHEQALQDAEDEPLANLEAAAKIVQRSWKDHVAAQERALDSMFPENAPHKLMIIQIIGD